MSVNDPNGGIHARAVSSTENAAATAATKTTTTKAAETTTTTTKAPATSTPSPSPTTTTAAPVTTSKVSSSSVVLVSSSVSKIVTSSVPVTTSSLPITTSSSIVPSTSVMLLTTTSALASVTPTAVASSSSNGSHTNLIGPIVGAVGGAAVILGAGILFYRRRRSKRDEDNADRTFSDYLASSDAAMRGRKSQQWTGGDNEYNRNSYMRSPASIAAGMYQQPSPRMVPAVGSIAATQAAWGSSSSQSPEPTVVGSPEQHQQALYSAAAVGGHNMYNHGYGNNQYYQQQPQYPSGQGYYQYNSDPYQQYGQEYQPYYDPATEQYVYPASAEYQQSIAAEDYGQAPHTYDEMPQQMAEQQRNYASSPLPAIPNTHSMASTVEEPRFPPNSPPLHNANVRGTSSPITSGDPHRTHTPDVSSAGQEPPST
ncbi:hypothetical protein K450DRAFT_238554 [Umbelopsis ramanniana AG]|uniref:Uncharacterized protein n=1 Tax=Umbelopsis ramanniana AG TaxID=1314678 RepID=A0AAD5EA28_UMBRA|nr:uncharacterized protein K450DRAFT_238554 [Umbelopsis ramanniana AG]KAI8580183.1 hypothetical protein K450DRAFT_238554 [Umbelopsis ramanniana AG]